MSSKKLFCIDTHEPAAIGPINKTRYAWCCDNGCGTCDAVLVEYRILHHTIDGQTVHEKTEPRQVSSCCGVGLFMWDNVADDEVRRKIGADEILAAMRASDIAAPTDKVVAFALAIETLINGSRTL